MLMAPAYLQVQARAHYQKQGPILKSSWTMEDLNNFIM
jgi:hypothetical protein